MRRPERSKPRRARAACVVVAAVAVLASAGASDATFPGRNGRIVFQAFVGRSYDIVTVNPDGSGLRRLTTSSACDAVPAWSPDGRRIAYERTPARATSNLSDLWLMNANGTGQKRLTRGTRFDGDPAWSPDGTKIVFESTRDGDPELYVLDVRRPRVVRRLTRSRGFDGDPAWSPGGRRIAFTSERDGNREIYLVDPDGSAPLNITRDDGDDADPAWSPSGEFVAFTSDRTGNADIFLTNDRFQLIRLTNDSDLDALATFSPDGREIVFVSDRGGRGNRDIYIMPAAGGAARPLVRRAGWDTAPDFQTLCRSRTARARALAAGPDLADRAPAGSAAPAARPVACERS